MNINVDYSDGIALELEQVQRWDVYHRLQELSIPCWCTIGQPLRVVVNDAFTLLQVWSVIKSCTASRQVCKGWLEHCWQASV